MLKQLIPIVILYLAYVPNILAVPDKEASCDEYAQEAVELNKNNKKYSCGYNTSRWSNDKVNHQKWCLTVNTEIYNKENKIRKSMLDKCHKNYATIVNKKNRIPLPNTCIDPKNEFIPIFSYYDTNHNENFLERLRTPVTNGLIEYDFNNDKKQDFLFIEENKDKIIRVTTCVSSINKNHAYIRIQTGISFSYGADTAHYTYSYDISFEGGLLVAGINLTAHNEGSGSSVSYYKFDNRKNIFVFVNSSESATPVYYDYENGLEPYPFTAPSPL